MSGSTVINHMSQSVTGTFFLNDLVSINTMSGSINITVIPQPASSTKAPATLRLRTASGDIKVVMAPFLNDPSAVVPERIFESSVKSMSGSITAALIHNSQTTLSTMSGNISASLYPFPPSQSSPVEVQNISGSTSLEIFHYPPPHVPVRDQSTLRPISAAVRGASGNLKVRFPATWEGEVNAEMASGKVRCDAWEGSRVLRDERGRFRAVKGGGGGRGGRLDVRGSSMGVEIVGAMGVGLPPREEEEAGMGRSGERALDLPTRGEGSRRREVANDDDDDWTIVENEDGAREPMRKPPPSYEEAVK